MATVQLLDPVELRRVLGLAGNDLYPESDYQRTASAVSEYLAAYLADDVPLEAPDGPPALVVEAALAIGVEIWQHRLAPGGQVQAADWTPSPYRLGRGLLSKVQGLLGPYLDTGSMVG